MKTNRRLMERRLIENQIVKLRERIRGNLDRTAHAPIRAKLILEIHKLKVFDDHKNGEDVPGHLTV